MSNYYAKDVVSLAQSWIGKKESDGSHKAIIDIYNTYKPHPRGYKMTYKDPWCATFVSAISIKLGYTKIMPVECSCNKMIELYKSLGCWEENENRGPNAGDIIFYDWQDTGSGDNKGVADHVGIVEKVENGKITVIEGNISKSVGRRTIKVNGRYIRGYAVPKYDAESIIPNTNTKSFLPSRGYFKKGDTHENVGKIASFMRRVFPLYTSEKALGDYYGDYLIEAVKEFQKRTGLEPDGYFGPLTLAKLEQYGFKK